MPGIEGGSEGRPLAPKRAEGVLGFHRKERIGRFRVDDRG